jgi:hypothetical protein
VSADGTFSEGGLPDLPATLYARDLVRADVACVQEGVRPADGPFDVRPVLCGEVSGRLAVSRWRARLASGAAVLVARGPLRVYGDVLPDGSFSVSGVPPGAWSVELWHDGACLACETVTVTAGADRVVLLQDAGR